MAKKQIGRQKHHGLHRRGIIAAGVLAGAVILVVGMAVWTGQTPQEGQVTVTPWGDRLHRVPAGQLPTFAASESPLVQNAYRYAVAQPDALRTIPCYCGCEGVGHRHNGDCYVQARHSDGTVTFTSHGAT